ncbi:MAG: DNA polymerase III subunit gamma/tau [Lentisphaeria bacterium]|nr:DNA polymerase III subunit gamma/tau [Candidatus Neomarinimicrobiota bacterium]MCF7841389.1 DNA polymerase III subunit gamma/tau [Lentisphaeria bacterium]
MSYKVLSIKYRPQQFGDVVGQEHVTVTIRNAIERDRLGQGYIFTGPRGVGKTTTARLLAKALNCESPVNSEPCNACVHCKEITEGRSMDVQEIDGASTRGIDSIRELREVVKYPPTNSKYRVYIIDEIHMLTKEAFNALLKTLEEPPEQVLFIFATTEPHKVPATILSRCQRFDFKRIGSRDMVKQLQDICATENIKADTDSLTLIANKADGSLRDALSLLDQVIAFAPEDIDLNTVRQVLGIVDVDIYFNTMDIIAKQSSDMILQALDDLLSGGADVGEFLTGLAEHVRSLLIVRLTNSTDLLNLTESVKERILAQSKLFDERDLIRIQNMTLDTLRQLRQASNQRVAAELLLVKLTKMTRAIHLDELLQGNISSPEKKSPVGTGEPSVEFPTFPPKPAASVHEKTTQDNKGKLADTQRVKPKDAKPEKQTSHPVENRVEQDTAGASDATPKAPLTLQMVQEKWPDVISAMRSLKPMLATFLEEGAPGGLTKNTVQIFFSAEHEFQVEKLQQGKDLLKKALSAVFQQPVPFRLEIKADFKPEPKQEDEVWSHPVAQHVLSLFDGEIIKD